MSEHRLITALMKPFFRKGKETRFVLPGVLNDSSRILCLDGGDLSELIFHVPLLKAIRKNYPAATIDFLIPEKHQDLLAPSGLAKECLVYKENQLNPWRPSFGKLLKDLGNGKYDMTILMSREPHPRLELAALASGGALRMGPSHEQSWPAINFEIRPSCEQIQYYGDRLLSAGPFLNLPARDLNNRWPLPMELVRQMAQQVHFHKPNPDMMLVGVELGTDKDGKMLPLGDLHEAVRRLSRNFVCRVMALGPDADADRVRDFETKMSDSPLSLPRKTLMDHVLLLSQCDLFLAGNSDFFHLAVSLGLPTLGIFPESVTPGWIPYGRKRVTVLHLDKEGHLDPELILPAVEEVTGGRGTKVARVIPDSDEAGSGPSSSHES